MALAAALLPVAGVASRLVAFYINPISNRMPVEVTWSAPLPALVLTGLSGTILAIPTLFLVPFLISQERRQASPNPRLALGVRVIGSVALVCILILMPAWPLSALVIISAWVGDRLVKRQFARAGRLILSRAWPTVVVIIALGAVLWGFTGLVIGAEASDVIFRQEVAPFLHSGRYVELGDNASELFLQDCSRPTEPIIRIDRSQILISRLSMHQGGLGPSLVNALIGHREVELGFKSPC